MMKHSRLAVGFLALTLMVGCKKADEKKPAPPAAQPAPPTAPPKAPAPVAPPTTHDEHHEEAAAEGEGAAPTAKDLKEAAGLLAVASQELAAIVKDGDLSKAHVVADRLAKLGSQLPDLATKAGLGADDVKALTIAGKKLGLLFADMDEAGDGGKRDEAQQVFARYQEPLDAIKAKAALAK